MVVSWSVEGDSVEDRAARLAPEFFYGLRAEGEWEMKHGEADVKHLARLLETAAKKQAESAEATCSVADCVDRSDGDLGDEMFDCVFETVTGLAGVSLDKKPDYQRAARELIARIERIRPRDLSERKSSPRRKRG
jgi:hypothetical protein